MIEQNLNGPFFWFTGVVEDINDPEILGRARVRVHGYHTEDKAELPTVQLPWAHAIFPITSASNRGKGQTVPGFLPGTHVFGFFLDGEDCQQPMIMGCIPGINSEENDPLIGFNVPSEYEKLVRASYNGKPDTNERATKSPYDMDEVHPRYMAMEMEGVDTAFGDEGRWSEPSSPANPKYPHNKVYESTTGHVIEIDDTSGAERIHVMHNTGSFVEFHPDGSVVLKSVGDEYHIVLGNNNMFVAGTLNITALGNVGIKAENFTFKGQKANFELEDDFVVNCKNFLVKSDENIDMGSKGSKTRIGAADKVEVVNDGGAKIVLEGNTVNLNPAS